MCEGYNRAMKSSDAKYKVYLHHDVWIMHENFIGDLISIFESHPKTGLLGLAGDVDLARLMAVAGDREGKRYTVDEDYYSYANGKCHVRMHRQRHDGTHHWKNAAYEDCVFDMMNIFLRARSFDPANWKKGYVVKFPIVDGNGRTPAQIKFFGKETISGRGLKPSFFNWHAAPRIARVCIAVISGNVIPRRQPR